MDLIALAQERRDYHHAELAKIEAFLATAYALQQELEATPIPQKDTRSDAVKADLPKRKPPGRPAFGIGADTLNVAEALVRERGPLTTKEMLPLVRAKGIEVGGKDPVATLSARVSNKGDLITYNGKWHFKDSLEAKGLNGTQKEAPDNPTKDQSGASLFSTNQGGPDGTALAS